MGTVQANVCPVGCIIEWLHLGSRNIMFVDAAHLSGSYEGTLLGAVGLDAGNHLFDVAYAIVSSENNED